ncbi:hypothetical protein EDB85DRAFT_1937482 [Lactarius pseudohatsudake]|nr:hypothetical protein EDB85DRAFT_1937482 [Lactarius pseudohatsudake]
MPEPSFLTPLLSSRPSSGPFPSPLLLWRTGASFVAAGMIAGAFGAHALKSKAGITPDQVSAFTTAAHYAIYNGLGLCMISLHPRFSTHRFAGPAIALGGFIFSTSIMALVFNKERARLFGPVTPLGGTLAIAGYISLAF